MCVLQWTHQSQCTYTPKAGDSLQSAREQVRASIKVRRRVIISEYRVVGQAYRQSESSQRAQPADDPRQNTQFRKNLKRFLVRNLTSFCNILIIYFYIPVTPKPKKLKAEVVIAVQE